MEPGGYYVFDVTLKPELWESSPLLEKPTEHGTPCRMRAIYSIEADQYAREEHAWKGTSPNVATDKTKGKGN